MPKRKRAPRGYVDVTKEYLPRMTGTCTKAAIIGKDQKFEAATNVQKSMSHLFYTKKKKMFTTKSGLFPGIDASVLPKLDRAYFERRMVCLDKDYSDEAREAFSSQAGALYVPPSIKATTVDGQHALSISCGAPIKLGALIMKENPKCVQKISGNPHLEEESLREAISTTTSTRAHPLKPPPKSTSTSHTAESTGKAAQQHEVPAGRDAKASAGDDALYRGLKIYPKSSTLTLTPNNHLEHAHIVSQQVPRVPGKRDHMQTDQLRQEASARVQISAVGGS